MALLVLPVGSTEAVVSTLACFKCTDMPEANLPGLNPVWADVAMLQCCNENTRERA